jgi:cell division protein YceG involved in septum cleavage
MDTTPRGRFWIAIGSPQAVRIIYVVVVVYAVILGALVLGYSNVQSCLADYSDANAKVLQIRADITLDERAVQRRIDVVDTSDRLRLIANQQALGRIVEASASGSQARTVQALREFQKINNTSLKIFDQNTEERSSITVERARIDKARADTPIPGPPSEQC